jgi:hypothetical protein
MEAMVTERLFNLLIARTVSPRRTLFDELPLIVGEVILGPPLLDLVRHGMLRIRVNSPPE